MPSTNVPIPHHIVYETVRDSVPGRPVFVSIAGSHMRGIAHAGSDIDVKAVYAFPAVEYARLSTPPETKSASVEVMGRSVEIDAWDVRKFLRLLAKSNPTAIEMTLMATPVYMHSSLLEADLHLRALECYSPKAFILAQRGLATSALAKFSESNSSKHLAQALWSAMVAHSALCEPEFVPHADFSELMTRNCPAGKLRALAHRLEELRKKGCDDTPQSMQALASFASEQMDIVMPRASEMPSAHPKTDVAERLLAAVLGIDPPSKGM